MKEKEKKIKLKENRYKKNGQVRREKEKNTEQENYFKYEK